MVKSKCGKSKRRKPAVEPLRRIGRRIKIEVELVAYVLSVLTLTRKDLFEGIVKDRQKRGVVGPDESNFRKTLRLGSASEQVYTDILRFLQERIREAHERGMDPKKLPMLLRLDEWPPELMDEGGSHARC